MHLDLFYSDRARKMKTSEIREFFKLTERPDIISFAGGFPSADGFPLEALADEFQTLMAEEGKQSLQYCATEGISELREYLAAKMASEGCNCSSGQILITTGSQQGLDLLAKVLLNPGDPVLVEEPGYVGGLGAIHNYQGNRIPVPMDEEGIRPDRLVERLEELKEKGLCPKFAYLVPNFQNPTGVTMSLARRKQILELARRYNFLIIEDNPYGELRYEGQAVASLKSLDTEGRVIYLGSFSKTFIPGLRVGWVLAPEPLVEKMSIAKQATDLCSNTLGQKLAYRFVSSGKIEKHVAGLISVYRSKRNTMLSAMEENFPLSVNWTHPQGGFFVWVTFPEGFVARKLLLDAIAQKVAFVDGAGFYVNGNGQNTARFAFSEINEDKIWTGINRLGLLLQKPEAGRNYA